MANGQTYSTNVITVPVIKPSLALTISGDTVICGYSSVPYDLTGGTIPCSSPVTWTASPAGIVQISSSSVYGQTYLSRIGTGQVTLTASTAACGISVSKTIQVGASGVPATITKTDQPCSPGVYYQTFYMVANNTTSNSNWNWYVESSTYNTIYNIYSPSSTSTLVNVQGSVVLRLRYQDGCGNYQTTDAVTLTSSCGSYYSIIVSPNPSSGIVKVTTLAASGSSTTSKELLAATWKIYKIEVMDKLGNVLKQFKYTAGVSTADLNLSGLLPGGYNLRAYGKDGLLDQQQFLISK